MKRNHGVPSDTNVYVEEPLSVSSRKRIRQIDSDVKRSAAAKHKASTQERKLDIINRKRGAAANDKASPQANVVRVTRSAAAKHKASTQVSKLDIKKDVIKRKRGATANDKSSPQAKMFLGTLPSNSSVHSSKRIRQMESLIEVITSKMSFDTRPPMLDKADFASWQQRIRLYCRGKDNGVNILKSINEGPFQMGTTRVIVAEGTEDIRATNIILQGLPKDIYSLINHYTDAKDIWDNVKMLLEGSELTKEDRESQLYDDFEHFRQNKGQTIHDYYVRFSKLINDMRNIKMTMSKIQLSEVVQPAAPAPRALLPCPLFCRP
ncbi:hypothetical protein Tco_0902805 [Tanacetum coccineum]